MNRIKIDLERTLSDIDRNIFGGYMEIGHLDTRFKFLHIGDSPRADKYGLRTDVRKALERLKISNIRFPGGNFASGYRWMDGVGPKQNRPTRKDLAHDCLVTNEYGTDEFVRFCRAMDIEPYLCVNCGDGDMREAADWVEYCNGTGAAAPANLRRKNGFTEPHKVKYWGIGNEADSPEQIGYKTPQEYARAYTEFSKVMKRVDPGIKLIASAVCSWEDFPLGSQFLYRSTEWVERAQLLLEQAGDRIDYLAVHRYAHPYEDDPHETYMAFTADLNERLNAYEGLIRAVSLERGISHQIKIAVDEWAVARLPVEMRNNAPVIVNAGPYINLNHTNAENIVRPRRKRKIPNLETALVTGMYLNAFIRHAGSVSLASFSSMPASLGMNIRPDKPVVMETIFCPFELYSQTCGQTALDVFWDGDTFSGSYKNRSYSAIRTLDVAATLNTSSKQLAVFVVNQEKDKPVEAAIALDSGVFTGTMKVSVVNGPDIKAENNEENPNVVETRVSTVRVTGKSFTFIFEPHSITALEISLS